MAVLECDLKPTVTRPGKKRIRRSASAARPEGKVVEDGGDKDMFADEGGENTGMEAKEVEESENDETIDAKQQK